MNNYEKIISMSINEMAEFIKQSDCYYCPVSCCKIWHDDENYSKEACDKYAIQWLKEEYNEM